MGEMLTLLPEYSSEEFDSRHRLVIVAAQRAKQLVQGARMTASSKFTKETSIALDEVLRQDRKSTRLNSSHSDRSRMPSSA